MADDNLNRNLPTVSLSQAKSVIAAMAHEQSILLLSPPGVGKSDSIVQAATGAGLPCRSLLGTQIAPEDVSGIPRIVGERSVFCPPRILLPENPEPFCLFLDELPACTPDIQKAFYSLLLERRLGEYPLPKGTWVVAAGNRAEDRSLVRSLSAALVNRVIILNVRVDVKEWLQWATVSQIRPEIRAFITFMPDALIRPIPQTPTPFSTPRAWASLSGALDQAEKTDILTPDIFQALAFGRVSPEDAAIFGVFCEMHINSLESPWHYVAHPDELPKDRAERWFIFHCIRKSVGEGRETITPAQWNHFFSRLGDEEKATLLIGMVARWGELGLNEEIVKTLFKITGVKS